MSFHPPPPPSIPSRSLLPSSSSALQISSFVWEVTKQQRDNYAALVAVPRLFSHLLPARPLFTQPGSFSSSPVPCLSMSPSLRCTSSALHYSRRVSLIHSLVEPCKIQPSHTCEYAELREPLPTRYSNQCYTFPHHYHGVLHTRCFIQTARDPTYV